MEYHEGQVYLTNGNLSTTGQSVGTALKPHIVVPWQKAEQSFNTALERYKQYCNCATGLPPSTQTAVTQQTYHLSGLPTWWCERLAADFSNKEQAQTFVSRAIQQRIEEGRTYDYRFRHSESKAAPCSSTSLSGNIFFCHLVRMYCSDIQSDIRKRRLQASMLVLDRTPAVIG